MQRWVPYQNQTPRKQQKATKKKRTYPERDLVHLPLMCLARKHPICKDYLIHIANERRTSLQQGALLKALGVVAGASDLFLAVPNNRFPGYWIELKAPGKKLSPNQTIFFTKMSKIGYAVACFDDPKKAWESILEYLSNCLIL